MKPRHQNPLRLAARSSSLLGLCTLSFCVLTAGHALAQATWDGGGTADGFGNYNWADGANWLGDSAPVATNTLTFSGTVNTTTSFNDIAPDTSFAGITFDNTAGAFTLSGSRITLGGNVVNNDTDLQTINLNMLMNATRTFDTASGNILVGGILSGSGSIGLSKNGTNTLILTKANSYQGNTTINAGVLRAVNNTAFGSTGAISLANTDTVLELADGVTINRPLTALNAGNNKVVQLQNGATAGEYSGSIQINETDANNFDFFAFAGGTLTVSGQITTSGNANITKEGAGTVIVSGNNTGFTRGVTINAGVLRAGHNNAFGGTGAINLVNTDTVLELANGVTMNRGLIFNNLATGNIINSEKKTLALQAGATAAEYSGGITINETTPGHVEVLVGSSGTLTISGAVVSTQAAGLTKTGAGTLILSSSSNGYAGNTAVNAGTLLVNNTSGSGSSGGTVSVASLATLGGTGTIKPTTTNGISIASGGKLAPGASDSIGALTLDLGTTTGKLTMATGSIFDWQLSGTGGTSDQLNFWNYSSGDVVLNNNSVNLKLTGAEAAGTYTATLFRFFSDSGIAATGGPTTGLSIGSLVGSFSGTPTFDYGTTGEIRLTYSVVPEPTSALAGLLIAAGLLRRRRA